MTRPLHPAYDLADLLATTTGDQARTAATCLRNIAELDATDLPNLRTRARLLAWADALDAAAAAL